MNYRSLTREQKTWIAELKRDVKLNRNSFTYVPRFECDIHTGEVYDSSEGLYGGVERLGKVGRIPLKYIPDRKRLLEEEKENSR